MADDTRQPPLEDLSREALTVHPEHRPFSGTQWQDGKAQPYKPPENANLMAGGTQHTAGGKIPEVTLVNALPTIEDFQTFHKRPCVRDALLTGIGGGAALGGIRAFVGSTTAHKVYSWAVFSFIGISAVMYQVCQYRRHAEKEGMMRAVEILNRKDIERKALEARKEKMREERRAAKDAEQDAQLAALNAAQSSKPGTSGTATTTNPWWKVW